MIITAARQQRWHQGGSHPSLTWVVAPILFSLGNVSTGVANPFMENWGFEPLTPCVQSRCSTVELIPHIFYPCIDNIFVTRQRRISPMSMSKSRRTDHHPTSLCFYSTCLIKEFSFSTFFYVIEISNTRSSLLPMPGAPLPCSQCHA